MIVTLILFQFHAIFNSMKWIPVLMRALPTKKSDLPYKASRSSVILALNTLVIANLIKLF
jgi:hypothetical protein